MERKAYPSDISDAEWALVAPYLTLMTEDAPQRDYPLREVFNGLRWMARGGSSWRMMPHDLPPYSVFHMSVEVNNIMGYENISHRIAPKDR